MKHLERIWLYPVSARDPVVHQDQDLIHKGQAFLLTDTLPLLCFSCR